MEDPVMPFAFVKEHLLPILLGVGGLLCLGFGLLQFLPQKQPKQDVLFESSTTAVKTKAVKAKEITVDIEGAVKKPGVYKLKAESLVKDALLTAGGLSDKADRGKVAQELNLAAKLTDGAKLYIPFVGETAAVGNTGASVASGTSTSKIININTASSQELEALPGIGEVTAGKIIAARPYAAIDELVSKKAVGKSIFEKIKGQVTVN